MNLSSFRDEFQPLLGGPRERRRIMREIRQLEAEELRRMYSGVQTTAAHEREGNAHHTYGQGDVSGHQESSFGTTYLTQPASLQGLTEGGGGAERRSSPSALHHNTSQSAIESLYGMPISSLSRGNTPSLVLTAMEEELDPAKRHEKMMMQKAHAATLSVPRNPPKKIFDEFMKAPSAMRKRGLRSPDVLFEPGTLDNGVFWLYDKHRVSQSTLGSAAGSMAYASSAAGGQETAMDEETFMKLPVWTNIKRKISNMIAQGAQQERYGIVFDIVSTGKILAKGIPHMAGRLIYKYIEDCRHEAGSSKLKFVFVGITDNINCCTARDVFCLDDRVGGVYVGDFKRTFRALDNVHMFAVLPPSNSMFYDQVLHASEPGKRSTSPSSFLLGDESGAFAGGDGSRHTLQSGGGRSSLKGFGGPAGVRRAGSASLASGSKPFQTNNNRDLPPIPPFRRSATPSLGAQRRDRSGYL